MMQRFNIVGTVRSFQDGAEYPDFRAIPNGEWVRAADLKQYLEALYDLLSREVSNVTIKESVSRTINMMREE